MSLESKNGALGSYLVAKAWTPNSAAQGAILMEALLPRRYRYRVPYHVEQQMRFQKIKGAMVDDSTVMSAK